MPKNNQDGISMNDTSKGLHTDSSPLEQPQGTYRFALNAVQETEDGNQGKLSNEKSNYSCTNIPWDYIPIGDKYIGNDTTLVICGKLDSTRIDIGLVNKNSVYTTLVNTGVLDIPITHQCDIEYRLRRGNERVVYWVNGYNQARTLNLDRLQNFYNTTYSNYLRAGGNPLLFTGEKWDASSFDLVKSYELVPTFSNIKIEETGSILSGSYNFAIQLIDEDLNPTEWITTSNTVNIFVDSLSNPFHKVRGSRNIHNSSQDFPRSNKSIRLSIGNVDKSFPYYRIAIICANGGTGEPNKVLLSPLQPRSNGSFVYTGNDSNLVEGSLEDILIDKEIIFAPRHITQLENRLILAHGKGKGINWCDFQKYATKISTDLTTKQISLNNAYSEGNVKNAKSTFIYRGYMPGEVYSFAIAYLFKDGYISPAFHIPGKNATSTSLMQYHEINDTYLDIHNCGSNNYWGVDVMGDTLTAKKIRHHRFPFRKDVNKPLTTTTSTATTLTKYKLTLKIALNPAWTPGPIAYPTDGGTPPLPLVIDYNYTYQVLGASSTNDFGGQLVDTIVKNNLDIVVYDDTTALDFVTGSSYVVLDPTSDLAATYQISGNERFIITPTYSSYVVNTSYNDDVSEIFGIEFSNIENPHPDVVGFYILRNERTDDDKIVIDNSVLGIMTYFNEYKSFGLLTPKDLYDFSNCGRPTIHPTVNPVGYHNQAVWFFAPEHQFLNKKIEYDNVEIEGKYTQTSVDMPTIGENGTACNGDWYQSGVFLQDIPANGGIKGVYIQDVQAGTSFNKDVNKGKDNDGFDMNIGYRNTNVTFALDNKISLPLKERIIYLNAAAYQNYNGNTYYNTSVDNKIGMYLAQSVIDLTKLKDTSTNSNTILYGALTRSNISSYSNFVNRTYYKEHNNPIMFGLNTTVNNVEIFNGDAQISAFNMVSSVFYDIVVANRPKKSSLWKIIVGAILVIAAVVATVATGGIAAPLAIVSASSLAISYGVALLSSGIKFEQFKSMVDVDYGKGLKNTVVDGGVMETSTDLLGKKDDTIRWFVDRISNLYIESSIPFGLRSGLTSGTTDFVDAPDNYDEVGFRSYLTEKFTVVDRDQGSGRLYKGYAGAEVYDMNLDYMRFNKEKQFIHLPLEYDCCADQNEVYPTRRWFSQQSFQEEKTDNYRSFLPNNYSDIEGENGEITGLFRLGNIIYIHTVEGLWQQPANLQERVTNEIVSFIGTGAFLEIPPRKVVDDNLGGAGTQHKWATLKTPFGVFFISELEKKIYVLSDRPINIANGIENEIAEKLKSFLSSQLYIALGVSFLNDNNPANPNGIGYISTYDDEYKRVVFTKRDYSILPDKLAVLVYANIIPTTGNDFSYCGSNGLFYQGTTEIDFSNPLYFEDRGFTLSYSFISKRWISWHSYIPSYYIHSRNSMYSFINGTNSIWKHNLIGNYQNFYGVRKPFLYEYVVLLNPLQDTILKDIVLQTMARKWDAATSQFIEQRFITFNKITVNNEKQCTGELTMIVKDTQASSQNWYEQQVVGNSANSILITSKGDNNWNINNFRDYVDDYTKPLFTRSWTDLQNNYFIDKIVNNLVINYNKNWNELQSFTGKFVIIRLKFDTFDDVNLIVNYTIQTEEPSYR